MLPSIQLTQSQDAAEHAFRAILFGMSISRVGHHELHIIAKEHRNELKDVWERLEPLLDDYEWLYEWRNVARYKHVDVPEYSSPEISRETLSRARQTAQRLIEIARS